METIFDISYQKLHLPVLIVASVFLLLGAYLYYFKSKVIPAKKDIETPFDNFENLSALKKEQQKQQLLIRTTGVFFIIFSLIIIINNFSPFISGTYLKCFRKNKIVTGYVNCYNESNTLGMTFIDFKIKSINFNVIKDDRFVINKHFYYKDSVIVTYFENDKNIKTILKISKYK